MKKVCAMFLSLLMLLSVSSVACAANVPEAETDTSTFTLPPAVEPLALVYVNDNLSSSAVFETQYFSCVSGNGNSLRYWFQNTGSSSCTVQLYKKTALGDAYTQAPFTVAAGKQKSQVFSNPGSKTFKIKVTATDGGVISGKLRANQLDLTTS